MTEEKVNPTAEALEPVIEASQSTEMVSAVEERTAKTGTTESNSVPQQESVEVAASAASEADVESGADAVVPTSETSAKKAPAKKRVVKKLSVGQEVQGTVKRVADFGAFVDIGVGRDGLVHISELSGGRVSKVSDVVSEGQEVTVWIRSLDRERNRISLTMRKPVSVDITTLQPDMKVTGKVTRIVAYGVFVDIDTGREALLHVREMSNEYVKNPADIVSVGQEIEARIIKVDPKTKQVDLSIKEAAESQEPEAPEEVMPEDPEEEVPTAMELALKEALADQGKEPHWVSKRRYERRKKEQTKRREQDDILARTLDLHRQWDDHEES